MTKIAVGLVLAGCVSLGGCAFYDMTYQPGGATPDPAATYAIVHFESGRVNLSEIICEAFAARGITVSIVADAESAHPSHTLVRYESSWFWDMDWFLHMITISSFDPANNQLQVATLVGRTSLSRNVPRKIVEAAMIPLYGEVKTETPAASGSCESPVAAVEGL